MLAGSSDARADSTCDAAYAQNLTRQGFAFLEQRDWRDAHAIGDQLALYSANCMHNFKIQNACAIYSFYFYAVSLHHLGDDVHAEEATATGLRALDQLKAQGGYDSLYDNLRPLFIDIQSGIAGHFLRLRTVYAF
jgi:hypothetical protein